MSQPAHTTAQNDQILEYLQSGKTITCLQAFNLFGIMNLHSRVSDLRNKMKVAINSKPVKVNSRGIEKRVNEYWIEKTTPCQTQTS